MSVSFGGGIAGAKEVERSAELDRLRLMSDTVSAALADVRKEQQSLRQQINELANEDGAIRRKRSVQRLQHTRKHIPRTSVKCKP